MATLNKKDINYLGKDFNQFRDNLMTFAKMYFKNVYNDFSENDPGMLFIELAAYVGDVLSFYLDYNLRENLLNYAKERANILDLAQAFGYKPKPAYPARAKLDVFQLVPSTLISGQAQPNWDYALHIQPNMIIASSEDATAVFRTLESINFASNTEQDPVDITIYEIDPNTTLPTYYLLKKTAYIEAGTQKTYTYSFGNYQQYPTITLPDTNIISIDSVIDAEGNTWYEVPYLAQDFVYIEIPNNNIVSPELAAYRIQTPYLLKIRKTSKRFITRYLTDNRLQMRFGPGYNVQPDEILTPNPDNVGQPYSLGTNKLNMTWDPANFIYTKAYGQSPANTTLTIKYTVGGGIRSNVPADVLTQITSVSYYQSPSILDQNVLANIKQSVACTNPVRAAGGRGEEDVEEIRDNAMAFFASQDRAVSKEDYLTKVYSMPPRYGSISKAFIVQDEQLNFYEYASRVANPLALNLYTLTYNNQKQLIQANDAIKENLKVYLNKYRMLTDSVNIKDAFIINFSIVFKITVLPDYVAQEVLLRAIDTLKKFFNIDNWQINQPIVKDDVIRTLAGVQGVQSIIELSFYNMFDSSQGYIPNIYNFETATRNGIIYPSLDPSIFEIRFPDKDIIGKVTTY